MQIKFGYLRTTLSGNTDSLIKLHSDGPVTLTFDLSSSPGGFYVAQNEIYFVRVEFSKIGVTSDMGTYLTSMKLKLALITKPTLDNITSATVLDEIYFNKLVNASRLLKSFVKPQTIPFVGICYNSLGFT